VLGDPETMARVRETGEAVLSELPAEPTLAELVPPSREFARETGLVTDRVEATVERVEAAGGAGTMAMVGESVVAIGVEDVLTRATRVANEGAQLR
jgi:pantoate kinase